MSILKAEMGITYHDALYNISVVNIMSIIKAIPPFRSIEDNKGSRSKSKGNKNRGGTFRDDGSYIPIDRSKAKQISWGDLNI